MSMSTLLRNTCKLNGACLLRTARLSPIKTFTSAALVAPKRSAQLNLVQNVQRNFSLTTPKLSGGSHTAIWMAERGFALIILGMLPVAFIMPSQPLDAALATIVVMHQHWGLEAIVVDYVRPIIFGAVIPKIAVGLLYAFSAVTLGGLFYFIYNDVGITKAIKQLWSIKAPQPEPEPEPPAAA